MERYLKSVSITSKDGVAVQMPLCCCNCKKGDCGMDCEDFNSQMRDKKVVSIDMTWGVRKDGWDCYSRCVFLVVLGFIACLVAEVVLQISLQCNLVAFLFHHYRGV